MNISGNLGDDVQFFIICTQLICAYELQPSFNSRRVSHGILDISGLPLRVSSGSIG